MNSKNCKQLAEAEGVELRTIYQRNWLAKNKEKWNEYKRKLHMKKKTDYPRVLNQSDIDFIRAMK